MKHPIQLSLLLLTMSAVANANPWRNCQSTDGSIGNPLDPFIGRVELTREHLEATPTARIIDGFTSTGVMSCEESLQWIRCTGSWNDGSAVTLRLKGPVPGQSGPTANFVRSALHGSEPITLHCVL